MRYGEIATTADPETVHRNGKMLAVAYRCTLPAQVADTAGLRIAEGSVAAEARWCRDIDVVFEAENHIKVMACAVLINEGLVAFTGADCVEKPRRHLEPIPQLRPVDDHCAQLVGEGLNVDHMAHVHRSFGDVGVVAWPGTGAKLARCTGRQKGEIRSNGVLQQWTHRSGLGPGGQRKGAVLCHEGKERVQRLRGPPDGLRHAPAGAFMLWGQCLGQGLLLWRLGLDRAVWSTFDDWLQIHGMIRDLPSILRAVRQEKVDDTKV